MEFDLNTWLWIGAIAQVGVLLCFGCWSVVTVQKLYADPEVSAQHKQLEKAVLDWFTWLSANAPNDKLAHTCVVNAALCLRPGILTTKPATFLKQLERGRYELRRAKALCDVAIAA